MIDRQDIGGTAEPRKEHQARKPRAQPRDPILKKLRYPVKSMYRVKYEGDKFVVVREDEG